MKVIKIAIASLLVLSLVGCIPAANMNRQASANRACLVLGGDVVYKTFSVECKLPSGKVVTTR